MRTVSTHCEKCCAKIPDLRYTAVRCFWRGCPDRHRLCVFGLCVFSIPRVFYHCPTSSATPVSKNTCRPGRKFFFFFYQDRPCVGHAAVRATPDCVHRVTVLCAVPCTLSHTSDPDGVSGPCLCHRVPLCSTMFYCAVLSVYYAVSVCSPRMAGRISSCVSR